MFSALTDLTDSKVLGYQLMSTSIQNTVIRTPINCRPVIKTNEIMLLQKYRCTTYHEFSSEEQSFSRKFNVTTHTTRGSFNMIMTDAKY